MTPMQTRLTWLSLALAAVSFVVQLLWLKSVLPLTSDQGQVVISVAFIAWAVVTLSVIGRRNAPALLLASVLAMGLPTVQIAQLVWSCSYVGDCL
jgi:hypothetical protein